MSYILIGLLAGLASGIGLGGGIVLIPALTILYAMPQQQAQSINLLYFLPTAVIALITHVKNGNIEKKLISPIAIFGIIGCIAGSLIALGSDPEQLKKFFGYFLIVMGAYEFLKAPKSEGGKSMEASSFEQLKQSFLTANTDEKVKMYVTAKGLDQMQYKELLRNFPFGELHKLEQALETAV